MIDAYYRDYSIIIYRKEQSSIKTTVFNECKAIVENINLSQYKEYQFEFRYANSKTVFKGIDKEGKIKGLKGYRKLLLDEVDQFKQTEFSQSKLRLRGEDNQQLLFTWNPVDENHWIKKYTDNFDWQEVKGLFKEPHKQLHENSFVKRFENKILIKTTYLDNRWVTGKDWGRYDEHVIKEFETLKKTDSNAYNVYALGNYGTLRNDNPFVYMYNQIEMNSNDYKPSNQHELHLSFDFNHTPTTCSISQPRRDLKKYITFDMVISDINTFKGLSPILACCKLINERFVNIPKSLWRVTGDSAGLMQQANQVKGFNYFKDIEKELSLRESQFNVTHNIDHVLSGKVINDTMAMFGKTLEITGNTLLLQNEIKNAFADLKGTLNEWKKDHGGHYLDNYRYKIHSLLVKMKNKEYKMDIKRAYYEITGEKI